MFSVKILSNMVSKCWSYRETREKIILFTFILRSWYKAIYWTKLLALESKQGTMNLRRKQINLSKILGSKLYCTTIQHLTTETILHGQQPNLSSSNTSPQVGAKMFCIPSLSIICWNLGVL